MKRYRPASGVAIAALALVACVQVYPPAEGPAPAQPTPGTQSGQEKDGQQDNGDEKKSPFKPYDKVLEDTKAIDGFFKLHLKRDQTLFLELRPEQLDQDFGLMMHYSQGIGDFNVHDGLPIIGNTRLMRFQRVGDQLVLFHRNPRFTADENSPMAASVRDNVGHSVVAAFDIKSKHEETGNLVIDISDWIVSDYGDNDRWLKFYYGGKPVRFDKKRSFVSEAKGFPENVEIDALLTFAANSAPAYGGPGVSDFRSIPVGVRYSLFELPGEPMQPRFADDRVGHFLTAMKDFSRDQKETWYVRFVDRWRLEKQDPDAELSEPVEPIVFYIDRTVPQEYRKYVKEGIEAWNRAFEAAAFKNAVVAKQAPTPEEDPDWSAEDIRYSTVRWTAAHNMGYAIGPSQTDPRTGEILNADVLISSGFVRSWLHDWQELANGRGATNLVDRFMEAQKFRQQLPPELAARFCMAEVGKAHQLGVGYALLLGLGELEPSDGMPEDYLGDAIRDLIMHEVGHTLGLRHNFKASSGVPHDRLNDTDFTGKHGVSLSVMDYNPVNVAVNRSNQGYYYNKEVGTYDVWAIRYAYTPIYAEGTNGDTESAEPVRATPKDELPALRRIASQGTDPLHTYGTDEDNWLGPYAVDPLTNAWDLSSDPVSHARDRAEIVSRVTPRLGERLIAEGERYSPLRGAFGRLLFERFIAAYPVTKTVGGLYFHRDHKGDPNARSPFVPASAAEQREAVELLVEGIFAEDAFEFDPELLNRLAPNRYSHWGVGWFVAPVDYPVHAMVGSIQGVLLDQVLNPIRISRMIDNELRTRGDVYTAVELFDSMTEAIWSELGGPRSVSSIRRNLQRSHTEQLITLLLNDSPTIPEDARSLARLHLERIAAAIEDARGAPGLNEMTRAHLDETRARIDRALHAGLEMELR